MIADDALLFLERQPRRIAGFLQYSQIVVQDCGDNTVLNGDNGRRARPPGLASALDSDECSTIPAPALPISRCFSS